MTKHDVGRTDAAVDVAATTLLEPVLVFVGQASQIVEAARENSCRDACRQLQASGIAGFLSSLAGNHAPES